MGNWKIVNQPSDVQGVRLVITPLEVFLSFYLRRSALGDSSSCSFIPRVHFETSLVMVSDYGYEI